MKTVEGGKFHGGHHIIDPAWEVVKAARDSPLIVGITVVASEGSRGNSHGGRRIKFDRTDTGIKVTVRASSSLQIFYIKTAETSCGDVENLLKDAFNGKKRRK